MAGFSPRRCVELRHRGNPIDNELLIELDYINWEVSRIQSLLCLENTMSSIFRKPFDIENHIRKVKQLDNLWELFSEISTKLPKRNVTDSDADIIDTSKRGYCAKIDEINAKRQRKLCDDFLAKFCKISVGRWQMFLDNPCEEPVEEVLYAVMVSTLSLLSIVYQYLLGYVFNGGTKAYSSGSLDFRDTFVSLLLFQGSYVWIFFRDVAPRNVHRRSKRDGAGRVLYYYGKFEPRFKPHRERQSAGTVLKFNYLPLGGYDNERDAKIVCQIAGYYYKRDEADIELRDGSYFTIPPMPEHEQSLFGLDKVRCVVARAKEVFRNFQVKDNATLWPSESNTVDVHDFFQHVVSEKFSLDALWDAADNHPVDWEFADSFGGTPASPSLAEQVVRPQSNDAHSMTVQESSVQQLKEQLEALDRRIAEQHEQHLQREKQLEERITKIQLENEERIAQLQLDNELLKCPMH